MVYYPITRNLDYLKHTRYREAGRTPRRCVFAARDAAGVAGIAAQQGQCLFPIHFPRARDKGRAALGGMREIGVEAKRDVLIYESQRAFSATIRFTRRSLPRSADNSISFVGQDGVLGVTIEISSICSSRSLARSGKTRDDNAGRVKPCVHDTTIEIDPRA